MKIWFTRLLAALFVVSLLITPQAQLFADDALPENDDITHTSNDTDGSEIETTGDDGEQPGADVDADESGTGVDRGENVDEPGTNAEQGENADVDSGSDESNPDDADLDSEAGEVDETETDVETTGDEDTTGVDDQSSPANPEPPAAGDVVEPKPTDGTSNDSQESAEPLLAPLSETTGTDEKSEGESDSDEQGNEKKRLISPSAVTGLYRIESDTVVTGNTVSLEIFFDDGADISADHIFTIVVDSDDDDNDGVGTVTGVSATRPTTGGNISNLGGDPTVSGSVISFSLGPAQTVPAIGELYMNVTLAVEWEACQPSVVDYHQEIYVDFHLDPLSSSPSSTWAYIENPVACPGSGIATVGDVWYSVYDQELGVDVLIPSSSSVNQVLTLQVPSSLALGPGPFDIWGWDPDTYDDVKIGQAQVNGNTLTLTLEPYENLETYVYLGVDATVLYECAPGETTVYLDTLEFIADPGGVFIDTLDETVLCDADPISKKGEWVGEGDDAYILWTIDTGDILGIASVRDFSSGTFTFDCSSLQISILEEEELARNCNEYYFQLKFQNGEVSRAVITIHAHPVEPVEEGDSYHTSFLNCAYAENWIDYGPFSLKASSGTGLGGEACYELFRPGIVGDSITKTVANVTTQDATGATAETGDILTYTVVVQTQSPEWGNISVRDYLPAGFEVTSINCTVEPIAYQLDSCFAVEDGVIVSGAETIKDDGYLESGPATITLIIVGKVTALEGELVNQACSLRDPVYLLPVAVGNPAIPGGGLICESVVTTILVDEVEPDPDPDPGASPSPSPSPSPTGTIIPTETATPTETAEPSETPTEPATPGAAPTTTVSPDPEDPKSVTGLPSTGSGGSGTSAMFIAAIAASLLIAGVVGIRMRPSH